MADFLRAINIIKKYEGYSEKAYPDAALAAPLILLVMEHSTASRWFSGKTRTQMHATQSS
jgi:GH24 family phage-related lysozyme (muramidase)